jgi:hypothetical protein
MRKNMILGAVILLGLLLFGYVISKNLWMGPKAVNLFPIIQDGKYGYINDKGKIIISPQFDYAENFSEELAAVNIGGGWGDLRPVEGGKWGYINACGTLVVSPQFDYAMDFSEGRAAVCIKNKWGFINKKGEIMVAPQFEWAFNFSEGVALVKVSLQTRQGQTRLFGYIDLDGNFVIRPQFASASSFFAGLAAVVVNAGDKYRFINKKGETVIPPQFDYYVSEFFPWKFSEGLVAVVAGEKWGFINKAGRYVINPQFDTAANFSEGLAAVNIDQKWGYINKKGEVVIKPQFEYACSFSEKLAAVKVGMDPNQRWGYIDKAGNFVINPQYEGAFDFVGGLAKVVFGYGANYQMGYINKEGRLVWGTSFLFIKTAQEVILALKNKDMIKLAGFVHPQKGVRFSPYAYVDFKADLVFSRSQVENLFKDKTKYLWGYYDGSGEPINLTFAEYFEKFIYDRDFLNAKKISYNQTIGKGNTINNSFEVYPGAVIIEYHFPGFDPQREGTDWESLRLVFKEGHLVGIIHDLWTI